MTTSQDLNDRIVGQNLAKRFLTNLDANASVEVVRWKDSHGAWHGWTMTELADVTARLATGLTDLGVGKGDTVVLMMRNRPEFHALDLAVLFVGATPVSIYNSTAPEQIDYLVNDCKAKVAVVEDDAFLERFLKVRESLVTLETIVLVEPSETAGDAVVPYADLIASEPSDLRELAEIATLDDIATIIYTSGTTGPPKGVMLSHGNIAWTLESVGQSMREQTDIENFAGKKHLSYLPMAHIFERLLGHYYLLDFAAQVTCCPETSQLTAYTSEVRPNGFIGVPRVLEKLYAGVNAALSADPEKSKAFNEA
ncbi:MAG TPA: AMP-binding protein, partial [Ilumatobacteraceae bacterium]|nr:AMP-binding protein [Ilumatobacteraceae bacterium]